MFSTGRVVLKVSYFKPAFNTDHTITPKIRTPSIFNESSIPVEEKRLPRGETDYLISSFYSSNVVRICDSSIRQRIVSKYGCYHRDQNRQHLKLSRRQQDWFPRLCLIVACGLSSWNSIKHLPNPTTLPYPHPDSPLPTTDQTRCHPPLKRYIRGEDDTKIWYSPLGLKNSEKWAVILYW